MVAARLVRHRDRSRASTTAPSGRVPHRHRQLHPPGQSGRRARPRRGSPRGGTRTARSRSARSTAPRTASAATRTRPARSRSPTRTDDHQPGGRRHGHRPVHRAGHAPGRRGGAAAARRPPDRPRRHRAVLVPAQREPGERRAPPPAGTAVLARRPAVRRPQVGRHARRHGRPAPAASARCRPWSSAPTTTAAATPSTLTYTLPDSETVQARVYDAAHRVVRVSGTGTLPAGTHHWTWDGRGAHGAHLRDGAYQARAQHRPRRAARAGSRTAGISTRSRRRSPGPRGRTPASIPSTTATATTSPRRRFWATAAG